MGMLAKFKPIRSLIVAKNCKISVPDIKEYLVREYDKVQALKLHVEELEAALEASQEIQLKYDASLVTLDEYSKRTKIAEDKLEQWKEKYSEAQRTIKACRDEINTYKIQLHNAALTREEIQFAIIDAVSRVVVKGLEAHKGTLSKKVACEIVRNVCEDAQISKSVLD